MESLDPFSSQDGRGLPAGMFARIVDHDSVDGVDMDIGPDDGARILRMKDPGKRRELERSLMAVKQALPGWLGAAPADCVIVRDSKGAPSLPALPGTRISISRTEGWTAVAVSSRGAIGIDLERIRPIEWRPMLAMVCAPREARLLLGLDQGVLDAFYRLWTAKEAVMKATGEGFRMGATTLCLPDEFVTGSLPRASLSTAHGVFDISCAQQGDLMAGLAIATD